MNSDPRTPALHAPGSAPADEPQPHAGPIDRGVLLDQCMGEGPLAVMVLERFEAQLRSDLEKIVTTLEARELTGLPKVLHALKGTAGAVGAMRLYRLAASMEAHAREGHLERVLREGPELCREVHSCLACAAVLRDELS